MRFQPASVIAIVQRKYRQLVIDHPGETRVAAFVGNRRPALLINAGQPEDVPALNESNVHLV
jgi:hypothetical protein